MVVDRLRLLAEVCAVDVFAYAVMSSHFHLVLRVDPLRVDGLSVREVVERWCRVFPAERDDDGDPLPLSAERLERLAGDGQTLPADIDHHNQRVRMALANGDYWSYGYDAMGQVRYAAKYQSSGALVPGYAFGTPSADGFTYDDIGNRRSAQWGDSDLSSSYFAEAGASGANGANAFNQYG